MGKDQVEEFGLHLERWDHLKSSGRERIESDLCGGNTTAGIGVIVGKKPIKEGVSIAEQNTTHREENSRSSSGGGG